MIGTIQCYDPTSDTCTTMNTQFDNGTAYASIVNINNKAYIFGGKDKSNGYLNTIQCYE